MRQAYTFIIISVTCVSVLASSKDTFSKSVGDILGSLQNFVSDYIGDKNGCVYECPKGFKAYENSKHVKASNGCGSFGFKLDSHLQVKELTKCCDEHDYCYDTCNKAKEKCDSQFKKCLTGICKSIKGQMSKDGYEACNNGADMIYAATVALGCKPYKDSQAKACTCKKSHREL